MALYRHVHAERGPGRARWSAGDADPEHRAGDGCRDHRPGLHRRGDRRVRLVLGYVLGIDALRPGAVVRYPCFPRFLAVLGLRLDGGDPHRPALGPVRKTDPMTRRFNLWSERVPWALIIFLIAL